MKMETTRAQVTTVKTETTRAQVTTMKTETTRAQMAAMKTETTRAQVTTKRAKGRTTPPKAKAKTMAMRPFHRTTPARMT